MIEIAMDDEKRKALLSGVTNPVQAAPLMEQKPGPMQEIGKTVLDTTINKGIESAFTAGAGTPATAATATTAATPAVAGGLGPAAAAGGPYILAALAAGKLFGLYSHGGKIKGPLYAEEGTVVDRKDKGPIVPLPVAKPEGNMRRRIMPLPRANPEETGYTKPRRPLGRAPLDIPGLQGPISKIKYKSKGGEVTEIDYGLK